MYLLHARPSLELLQRIDEYRVRCARYACTSHIVPPMPLLTLDARPHDFAHVVRLKPFQFRTGQIEANVSYTALQAYGGGLLDAQKRLFQALGGKQTALLMTLAEVKFADAHGDDTLANIICDVNTLYISELAMHGRQQSWSCLDVFPLNPFKQ